MAVGIDAKGGGPVEAVVEEVLVREPARHVLAICLPSPPAYSASSTPPRPGIPTRLPSAGPRPPIGHTQGILVGNMDDGTGRLLKHHDPA
jgi:hypothetical protein